MSKPGWRYNHAGRVGSSFLVDLADATVSQFRHLGIRLKAGNRLETAARAILDSHDKRLVVRQDDHATNAIVGEALRDMWDFYAIARTLPADRDADLNGKLKVMVRGAPTPDRDRISKPRDFQFELLAGGVFAMAGIPAHPEEPDVRFEFEGQEWGAPVKRIRSENQLGPRITDARHQLEDQGLRGVVVINVDAFLDGVPPEGTPDEIGGYFDQAIARLHHLMPELAKQRSLLGILAMGRVVGWSFDGELPRLHQPWIIRGSVFVDTPNEAALAERLFQQIEAGSNARMTEWLEGLRPKD